MLSAMALGIVASAVYSYVQFREADKERRKAVAVSRFLEEMLTNTDPTQQSKAKEVGVNLRVVDLLDASAITVDPLEKSEPEVAVAVRAAIAGGYRGIGQYETSEKQARRALQVAQQKFGSQSWEYLQALEALARTKKAASQYAEAAPLQQQLIALYEAIAPRHEGYELALSGYAGTLVYLARKKEALEYAEKSMRVTEARTGEIEPRAYAMSQLAFVYNSLNRTEDYLRLSEQAVALRRTLSPPSAQHGASLNNLAHAYYRVKNYNRALDLQREAVEFYRTRLGAENPAVVQTMVTLAVFQSRAGRREEAVATAEQAVRLADRIFPGDHKDRAYAHTVAGNMACEDDEGREEALRELRFGLAMRQRVLGKNHGEVMGGNWNLALCLGKAGKQAEALAHLEETYRICVEEEYPAEDVKETVEKYLEFVNAGGRGWSYADAEEYLRNRFTKRR
jgi:tetratricopeptide (TPR) repeat protein